MREGIRKEGEKEGREEGRKKSVRDGEKERMTGGEAHREEEITRGKEKRWIQGNR